MVHHLKCWSFSTESLMALQSTILIGSTRPKRALKDSLKDDEIVVHVDFAENFGCKLNRQVQAFHFGGNRRQATVHSCVAYSSDGVQSFATISGSLRHDERAVWAHLEPVIKDVLDNRNPRPTTLHVMSDGPVTQYRNKK